MSAIRLKNLGKGFGRQKPVVRGVSLEVKRGELLGLVGESGSGKTTILRLIAGLEQPDSGSIEIGGRQVAGNGGFVEPQGRAVGLVFQDYALFPHMTVRENTVFGLYGWPTAEKEQRCREVLDLVGLSSLEKRYPHQLSGGQQQRVAIARALAPRPQILLLDEPFSNLDNFLKDQVRAEVKNIIKRSGLTAILVTHDITDALSTADRIALLKDGCLQQIDTPVNLYNHPLTAYVAGFFGKINLLPARFHEGFIKTDILEFPSPEPPTLLKGLLCIRPQQVKVIEKETNLFGKILEVEYQGNLLQLKLQVGSTTLWCLTSNQKLSVGQKIFLEVDIPNPHLLKEIIQL